MKIEENRYQVSDRTPLRCELCDLTFTSVENLNGHINGQKHKRKLNASATITPAPNGSVVTSSTDAAPSIGSDPTVPLATNNQPLHCIACDLTCSSVEQLTFHLKGKRHAKRCKRQAEYWVAVTQAAKNCKPQTDEASPIKTPKKRTFFRLPKTLPETSPEALLEMENALPLSGNCYSIASLPFCTLPSGMQTTESEPDIKRARLDPESANPSEEESKTEATTRFCGHLNCVLGRAAKRLNSSLPHRDALSLLLKGFHGVWFPRKLCLSKQTPQQWLTSATITAAYVK
ncbi:unnamed protein product [Echinostoma caproni]|uniref:C2H2-type domain-containing protein n=1 Tax=Echinostoma caproni TaxID=27848 RepID=A0A183A0X7_9TREM|nr:unnamed protein product [Echinostoma caproni]